MTTPDDFIRKDLTALRGLFLPNLDGDRAPDEIADNHLVHYVAMLMRHKLEAARKKGRGGWWDAGRCSVLDLRRSLRGHVDKGDMRDVINLAAMIYVRELVDDRGAEITYVVRRGPDGSIEAEPWEKNKAQFGGSQGGGTTVRARSLEHAKALGELAL